MAEHGILVRNHNNDIQIDSEYKNYAHHSHAAIIDGTWSSSSFIMGSLSIERPLTNDSLIIAAKAVGDEWVNLGHSRQNLTGSEHGDFRLYKSPGQVDLAYFIPVTPSLPASGDHGLMVNDSNGQRVFDSRLLYMNIVDVVMVEVAPHHLLPSRLDARVTQMRTFNHNFAQNPYYVLGSIPLLNVLVIESSFPQITFSDMLYPVIKNAGGTSGITGWAHGYGSEGPLPLPDRWGRESRYFPVVVLDLPFIS